MLLVLEVRWKVWGVLVRVRVVRVVLVLMLAGGPLL